MHLYPGLQLYSESADQIVLSGNILVNRISKGYTLCKEYQIEIVIPISSNELPYVLDIGNSIDKSYHHRYVDGRLCLETDTSIRIRFIEGFSLTVWMSEYVETYFFSYEYYMRYGEFPFGERGHGLEGILQTYEGVFNETDDFKVKMLMKSIISQPYRGHMQCPCGSGKKLRSCHGMVVMKYYMDSRLRKIVLKDYYIMEVIQKYDEQRRNSKKAK